MKITDNSKIGKFLITLTAIVVSTIILIVGILLWAAFVDSRIGCN